MATAAPPIARAGGGKLFRNGAAGTGALLLVLLLLTAVISTPKATTDCGDGGTSTGDVTSVGKYPRPLTWGPYTMLPGQLVVSDVVAQRTGWDLWVIRAQVYNEMNGAKALQRQAEHNNNWLNVGYDDNLGGQGKYQANELWKDPVRSGNAIADWIQGKRETLGQKGADTIKSAYEQGKNASPMEAIRLLQNSKWASSRYPVLPALYRGMVAAAKVGKNGRQPPLQAGIGPVTRPAALTPAPDVADFSESIKAAKAAHGSPVGFAVVDQSGTTVAQYRGTAKNTGRSMSKGLILVALTQRAKGRSLIASERSLATRMIEQSDNAAANQLLAEVGRSAVNRVARRAGMKQWNASAGRGKAIAYKLGTAAVSAQDFARFFARIDTYMAARHRAFATALLGNIQGAGRYGVLDAGFDGKVLSKGGWNVDASEGTVNQAAQVTVGGKTYGISVVLGHQKSLEAGGRQIATIAKAVKADLPAAGAGAGAAPSCNADVPVGQGIEAAGAIAKKYLHATSPRQMPGFTGAFPDHAWCSWFVTNVLRKAGVDIPVLPYSGTPYTWAKDHPKAWTLFKPLGKPSIAATPPVASLVMYKRGGGGTPTNSTHINMVEKTYPDGSFDVIGGNQGSGCPTGSCVSEHKACRLIGWKTAREPHLDCGDDRPIWGIVTPTATKAQART